MKLSWKIYLVLGIVLLGSIVMVLALPVGSAIRELFSIPGMGALFGALYQLVRDEAQYQKTMLIQKDKQEFDIAITSHMANVAFDKHVAFCEEYLNEFHRAMVTLYREAECVEMLTHAINLSQIKVRHRAWLTRDIEIALEPFEHALRNIGAAARFYEQDPAGANASGRMQEAYNFMSDIFGYKRDDENPSDENVRDEEVIQRVRKILGIEELTYLRYKHLGNGQNQQVKLLSAS